MDWFRAVDNYCERTDAGYWSEPVNALTNAAFLVAAVIAWRMACRGRDRGARLLAAILFAIGVGSYLFHTHARIWAMMADVLPIQVFILVYLYLATVRFFGLPRWGGLLAVAAFFPYAILTARGLGALVGDLNGSIGYLPVPILIAGYAFLLRDRSAETARGMAIGAGLLVLSLVLRTIDARVCPIFPLGTHFFWHLLNATLLGWLIAVLIRHGPGPGLARKAVAE